MYETPSPPHLFLNKLLKPNIDNVLGGPPTSLGNLLILPKQVHTIQHMLFQRGVVEMYEKCPASPPQDTC